MRLLFEASAPVRASVADVRAVIDSDWMLDALLPGDARSYVAVDRTPGTIGVQGHWWYRGEFSAIETPTGARLVQRVFNVALRGRCRWRTGSSSGSASGCSGARTSWRTGSSSASEARYLAGNRPLPRRRQ